MGWVHAVIPCVLASENANEINVEYGPNHLCRNQLIYRIGFRPRDARYAAKKATRITQECSAKLRNAACVHVYEDGRQPGRERASGCGQRERSWPGQSRTYGQRLLRPPPR